MLLTNHEVFASQLSSVIRSARHEAVDTVHVTFGRCLLELPRIILHRGSVPTPTSRLHSIQDAPTSTHLTHASAA
jgi:hypothetical protein